MARIAVEKNDRRRAVPWMTLALAATAGLALAFPPFGAAFIYERGLILRGEVWRLWTGQLAHFTPAHLGWNLTVLLSAGGWLERHHPVRTRWFYLVGPLVISVTLLAFDRTLARYAGLSGLAIGTVVLLACRQLLVEPDEPEWTWLAVLILVGAKIGWEIFTGEPLLAAAHSFRTVPLAHVAGALGGVGFSARLRGNFRGAART